jgi:hypothetical protein
MYPGLKGSAVGNFGFMKHKATKNTLTTTFVITDGEDLGGDKKFTFTYDQVKPAPASIRKNSPYDLVFAEQA